MLERLAARLSLCEKTSSSFWLRFLCYRMAKAYLAMFEPSVDSYFRHNCTLLPLKRLLMVLKRSTGFFLSLAAVLAVLISYRVAAAQSASSPLITQAVNESQLSTLAGNVSPLAITANDTGPV